MWAASATSDQRRNRSHYQERQFSLDQLQRIVLSHLLQWRDVQPELGSRAAFSPRSIKPGHPVFHAPHSHLGDEVAPFSAARQSAQLGRNAFISPRSFGCDSAALSSTCKPDGVHFDFKQQIVAANVVFGDYGRHQGQFV
jgi:hypothetical protein